MNWPTAIVLAVTFWCIGAAWGAAMTHRDDDKRYRHLVSADAGQRTAIRDLYVAEGYEPPDFYTDPEPEPRQSWWRRVGAKFERQKPGANVAFEFQAPTPEPLATCPDCGNELQSSMHWEECLRQLGDVEPETAPEPAPPTQPDLKQAAKVAPLPTFEEWQQEFTARVERDLAEIRGVK